MSGWKTNDTEPALAGVATDVTNPAAPVPINLSTATDVTLHVTRPDLTVISRVVSQGNQATAPGTWTLAWQTGDLSVPGLYSVELQITWSPGRIHTVPGDNNARFRVTQELA